MKKIEGEGRTRLTRFAAITIPAAVASAGMGFAVMSGMVGAVLSSTDGFQLQTDLTASSLKVRAGATDVGTADSAKETIYAEAAGSHADGLDVQTPTVQIVPGLSVHLSIGSTDTDIDLGDVALNAATLDTDGATLSTVKLGQAQSEAGFSTDGQDEDTGYKADAFSLTASGGAGSQVLPGVDSTAYAITLGSLSLNNLSLGVHAD
ncbi:DUF6230 family protein [Nocardioides sp. Kera G14]|uniref:DUF6230 family protein n=1 Tax=Nocardioides sp. Kera G14 TaxID=2884264 RepID=UPI001D0FFA81|nr:DUF6230 family protein [Nocardioides sp. Kera G14]UDY23198.1 DUF6230 family protein [Nocardioides sp. Kera G14]